MNARYNDHPEDAMTRERALEEALREQAHKTAEWVFQNYVKVEPAMPFVQMRKQMASDFIEASRSALASAQQEPAPSADVEIAYSPDEISETATRIVNRIWGQVAISVDAAHGICQEEIEALQARAAARTKSSEKGGAR